MESENYCPNCTCDTCQPVNLNYQERIANLNREIERLTNHVISNDKIIAELRGGAQPEVEFGTPSMAGEL